ncbi:CotO family spore coat protein [Aquibacillus halophilus]|nr:CotO family spore coat protein [Aquibacillus halophilus]
MKKRKTDAENPMLYIQQPELKRPKASMQSNYRTPKKKKTKNEVIPDLTERPNKIKKRIPKSKPVQKEEKDIVYGSQEDIIEELVDGTHYDESEKKNDELEDVIESENQDVLAGPRVKRKKFADMSNEEKVNYFVGLPSQVPRMRCEVVTEEERHRGVITDYRDGFVYMETVKRPRNKKVDINQISNIRLISF